MGKTWILKTETKGTGATMVPLESTTRRDPAPEPLRVPRKPAPRAPEPPAPRAPRRFRVVDLMTRETLIDDASAADTVAVLKDVRSTVDVTVSVWDDGRSRWRALTLAEQRTLFEFAVSGWPSPARVVSG
jgi:hypothetical protein